MTKNLVLIGFMGCGKTTLGAKLAKDLQYVHIDLDREIEKKFNQKIIDIFFEKGEKYFRKIEHETLKETSDIIIHNNINVVLSPGGGIIETTTNYEILKKIGLIIFINPPFEEILSRIQNDRSRPLIKMLDIVSLKKRWETRLPKYRSIANFEISDINDYKEILKLVR